MSIIKEISEINFDALPLTEAVYQKLRRGLELLGGLERFVSPREKILLKPNLVRRAENDRAVVTHPAVAGAMARLLREAKKAL